MTDPVQTKQPAKLWGGRFSESTEASVEKFTASIQYDWRLFRQDIRGSKAHAKMLARQGLITENHIKAELGEIVLGHALARSSPEEVTLFKSVGLAVQDLAAASRILDPAQAKDLGTLVSL